jgi:ABC-type nickel/cobalt efflux system permease component RcnA
MIILGQSVPNGGDVSGQVWTANQWNAAWQSKMDFSDTFTLKWLAIYIALVVIAVGIWNCYFELRRMRQEREWQRLGSAIKKDFEDLQKNG